MGALVQLFHRNTQRGKPKERPVATAEGVRLPDDFGFPDLAAFLESLPPASGAQADGGVKAAG